MVDQKKSWVYTINPHFFRLEKSGSANSDFFSGLRKMVDQKKKHFSRNVDADEMADCLCISRSLEPRKIGDTQTWNYSTKTNSATYLSSKKNILLGETHRVWPKPDFGIGNWNQDRVSVSV